MLSVFLRCRGLFCAQRRPAYYRHGVMVECCLGSKVWDFGFGVGNLKARRSSIKSQNAVDRGHNLTTEDYKGT